MRLRYANSVLRTRYRSARHCVYLRGFSRVGALPAARSFAEATLTPPVKAEDSMSIGMTSSTAGVTSSSAAPWPMRNVPRRRRVLLWPREDGL